MKKTNWKLWIAVLVGLIVMTGALAGVKALQIGAMIKAGKSFVPPPESVTSAAVEAADWQSMQPAVGTLVAVQGVTLASELPGMVRQIGFESGASVKKGTELVRLDTSVEEAQLQSAFADALLANQYLERARKLRAGGNNTVADLDAAEARAKQADASVAILRATIAKKTIRAPFDGRIGIRQVELGQVLSPGAPIATLQSVSPMYSEILLPQQTLNKLRLGMNVRMTVDSFPGTTWNGRITTINSEVDVATRNVRVRATFPNPDGRLRAGMFATINVLSGEPQRVLLIPVTAVIYAPFGDSVFTVAEKKAADGTTVNVVSQKFVRLGERRGDLIAVESGLQAGESVVSSGAFKLRNGVTVLVKNDLAPTVEIAPRPVER
jgi:membrane fusion protein (multidrug efflux system)